MAFNRAMDLADQRLPPKELIDQLHKLIAWESLPVGDGTYKVSGYVPKYSNKYDRWMKAQGITDINTMLVADDADTTKCFISFTISRVTLAKDGV